MVFKCVFPPRKVQQKNHAPEFCLVIGVVRSSPSRDFRCVKKSLKITTDLHCLIPPKMGHLMIPDHSRIFIARWKIIYPTTAVIPYDSSWSFCGWGRLNQRLRCVTKIWQSHFDEYNVLIDPSALHCGLKWVLLHRILTLSFCNPDFPVFSPPPSDLWEETFFNAGITSQKLSAQSPTMTSHVRFVSACSLKRRCTWKRTSNGGGSRHKAPSQVVGKVSFHCVEWRCNHLKSKKNFIIAAFIAVTGPVVPSPAREESASEPFEWSLGDETQLLQQRLSKSLLITTGTGFLFLFLSRYMELWGIRLQTCYT